MHAGPGRHAHIYRDHGRVVELPAGSIELTLEARRGDLAELVDR